MFQQGPASSFFPLPPHLYPFLYLSFFSTLLYFSRIPPAEVQARFATRPSRWKKVERTRVSNELCSNLSTVHPFTISSYRRYFPTPRGRWKGNEETRQLAGSGRERGTRKRREERTSNGHVAGTRHSRFCLSGRRAGRLITVAFCGFVARHDPRAFRGPHCSASNRSRNGAERSFFVGELVDSRVRRCPFTRRVHRGRRNLLAHFLFVPLLRFIVARNYIARAKSNIEQCRRIASYPDNK